MNADAFQNLLPKTPSLAMAFIEAQDFSPLVPERFSRQVGESGGAYVLRYLRSICAHITAIKYLLCHSLVTEKMPVKAWIVTCPLDDHDIDIRGTDGENQA
ncbi:hypothetical protein BV25DRAFT_1919679 [Artomyces pyxidatus]|uniref:Uncharacterized protein n=1 Tax=Artomyces pyxidatus TaxID=48021 RepID=A0ACB8SP49_9AGAM|nr:hypothetical protein BV25DRAFT_1919679 [Artomyces pyxidatus]